MPPGQKKILKRNDIKEIFKAQGAIISGHFQLSSGYHSDKYIQCAQVLQHPKVAEKLVHTLINELKKIKLDKIEVVIGPALGGIIFAYEMARQLNARALFAERDKDGRMILRRNFQILPGEKVLVVEDVITTGGSISEVIDLVKKEGGEVVAVVALVNRATTKLNLGVKVKTLFKIKANKYLKDDCPLCKRMIPISKPGSRK